MEKTEETLEILEKFLGSVRPLGKGALVEKKPSAWSWAAGCSMLRTGLEKKESGRGARFPEVLDPLASDENVARRSAGSGDLAVLA